MDELLSTWGLLLSSYRDSPKLHRIAAFLKTGEFPSMEERLK
jgi:hypothetical protein